MRQRAFTCRAHLRKQTNAAATIVKRKRTFTLTLNHAADDNKVAYRQRNGRKGTKNCRVHTFRNAAPANAMGDAHSVV